MKVLFLWYELLSMKADYLFVCAVCHLCVRQPRSKVTVCRVSLKEINVGWRPNGKTATCILTHLRNKANVCHVFICSSCVVFLSITVLCSQTSELRPAAAGSCSSASTTTTRSKFIITKATRNTSASHQTHHVFFSRCFVRSSQDYTHFLCAMYKYRLYNIFVSTLNKLFVFR